MDNFKSYLTYEDYKELGGTLPLDAFTKLERKAQRWLDSFTFNRIKYLTHIPDEVKEVLVEFISKLDTVSNQRENGDLVTQYSNGVEQLTYKVLTEEETKGELYQLAVDWLPNYLTYRGVNFDVQEYLQRNSNDTE
jgi:hypothetical protein